jgi:hypothetical protein
MIQLTQIMRGVKAYSQHLTAQNNLVDADARGVEAHLQHSLLSITTISKLKQIVRGVKAYLQHPTARHKKRQPAEADARSVKTDSIPSITLLSRKTTSELKQIQEVSRRIPSILLPSIRNGSQLKQIQEGVKKDSIPRIPLLTTRKILSTLFLSTLQELIIHCKV